MKTCSQCHIEKPPDQFRPGTKSAKCKSCLKLYDNAYYEKNKQKWRDRESAQRLKDPEAFKIRSKEAQDRYRANPDNTIRLRYLKTRYGIDIDQYVAMETAQGSLCAICQEPPEEGKRLHVDHCHATGKVRSLLCFKCNAALGNIDDSIKTLKQAIAYLLKHGVVDDS